MSRTEIFNSDSEIYDMYNSEVDEPFILMPFYSSDAPYEFLGFIKEYI